MKQKRKLPGLVVFTIKGYRFVIFKSMVALYTPKYIYAYRYGKLWPHRLTRDGIKDELVRRGKARQVLDIESQRKQHDV